MLHEQYTGFRQHSFNKADTVHKLQRTTANTTKRTQTHYYMYMYICSVIHGAFIGR